MTLREPLIIKSSQGVVDWGAGEANAWAVKRTRTAAKNLNLYMMMPMAEGVVYENWKDEPAVTSALYLAMNLTSGAKGYLAGGTRRKAKGVAASIVGHMCAGARELV